MNITNFYAVYISGLPAWINWAIGWLWVVSTLVNAGFAVFFIRSLLRLKG